MPDDEIKQHPFAVVCDHKNDTLKENNVPVWFQRQKGNLKHLRLDGGQ